MNGKLIGVVALALLVYANAPRNGFALDDVYLILDSQRIEQLDPVAFFTTDLFEGAFAWRYYRPLVAASFALEHALVGKTALLYHVDNVLLHALTTGLFFLLVLRLFRSESLAWVAAALFAVHPAHTEAVTAISGRGDLLSTFFLCAGALVLAGGAARWRGVVVVLLYVLALLSKESAVVGLSLLCLVAWVGAPETQGFGARLAAIARSHASTWVGLASVTLLFVVVRNAVVGDSVLAPVFMGNRGAQGASFSVLLGSCSILLAHYYELLLFPLKLTADYSYDHIPLATGLFEPRAVVAWGITALLAVVGLRGWKQAPAMAFGSTLLLAAVLPLAFVLPFLEIVLAERFLYLASVGFCLLVAGALLGLEGRLGKVALAVVVVLVVAAGAARTWVRNPEWRDDFALFAAAVEVAPRSARVQANRALSLMQRGRELRRGGDDEPGLLLQEQAVAHYARSSEIEPGNALVWLQQGSNLADLGRYDEAVRALEASIQLGEPTALVVLYRTWLDVVRHYAKTDEVRAREALSRARRLFRGDLLLSMPPALVEAWSDELEEVADLVR